MKPRIKFINGQWFCGMTVTDNKSWLTCQGRGTTMCQAYDDWNFNAQIPALCNPFAYLGAAQ